MFKFNRKQIEKSDSELLKAYKATGELAHVTDLFSKYHELIFGVCLKYLKNETESEDATMDIYEKIIEKLKTHNVTHVKSWLWQITKNHCLDVLGKPKELDRIPELPPTFPTEHQLNTLRSCIQRLIDSQKECVIKFYLEKQSYNDIATELSISWSRVRSLIQNGRRNLKICFERS